ncbi:MAG TPA: hypothetical protein VF727_11230 [Allosphingosinicella sp.]|jgi:hypothetical protein
MSTIALPSPSLRSDILAELLERQPLLARYGIAVLLMSLAAFVLQAVDPRTLHGVNVWVKPTKFLVSVGVFSLTSAWFYGYVRPERRRTRALTGAAWVVVASATLELLYIAFQASRGLDSHFNQSAPVYQIMYALMGLAAVLLIGTVLPLAWEVGRRPASGVTRDFAAAVVIGLVLTVLLGGGLGGYMSAQPGHSVGLEGGKVAMFGWNRSGGDLRIAHFLGIHAEQALPILALLIAAWRPALRWAAIAAGTVAYTGVTLAVFAQAVAGRPLLPL